MDAFDRQHLLNALVLVVMALFVSAGVPLPPRWRQPLRVAAIVGFALAAALALVETALWWGDIGTP